VSPSRRILPFAAWLGCLVVTLSTPACYREANDTTHSSVYPRYTGTAPWSIDGVRPGQTLDEIKRLRGDPAQALAPATSRSPTFRWPAPRATFVTFDAAGRAIDITGTTLVAEGRTLLDTAAESAAVEPVLGRGRVATHSQPSGSGVISLGSKVTGRTVAYENHGALFEIFCDTTQITGLRARPKK
jgi:hypothetical protein